MASAAGFFTRALADVFPGKPVAGRPGQSAAPTPTEPTCTPSSTDGPCEIGRGAPNETHVTITGIPNLFVDEGDCIVQFQPAFDEHTGETPFGLKILPDLAPHWTQSAVHHPPLKDAIAKAIRSVGQPAVKVAHAAAASIPAQPVPSQESDSDRPAAGTPARTRSRATQTGHHDSAAVVGRITWWGEDRFPDRKSNGAKFYTSFAIRLDTGADERTLQGEGLKEAIAECGCGVGDVVSVRRLQKIKVPAIRRDGSPKIVNGQQLMWDKWLWSITK
ncbi:hypothetical protein [Paraburkholderia sp. BL10I2N1]|uniref:hypothetical protein n=1 Tax=Paraburkholderia sp. BL10I2N1 TaxID=1938796 RepID=UPI00105D2EAE|nr:hypothetical protein [Paraburkholderia sp. BL10I2N1]TDN59079.1 hypothetical protein B0G77_8268 [Paraburkholderia sp. BL10I2N1]